MIEISRNNELTILTPILSDMIPHVGQATRAKTSSAKPNEPAASPTPLVCSIRSVITKEMEEFKKTKKEIENNATPRRYVTACSGVDLNMADIYVLFDANVTSADSYFII